MDKIDAKVEKTFTRAFIYLFTRLKLFFFYIYLCVYAYNSYFQRFKKIIE